MWFIHEPIESGHLGVIGTFVISKKRVDNRAQTNYNTTYRIDLFIFLCIHS